MAQLSTNNADNSEATAFIRQTFADYNPRDPDIIAMAQLIADPQAFDAWIESAFGADGREYEDFVKATAEERRAAAEKGEAVAMTPTRKRARGVSKLR